MRIKTRQHGHVAVLDLIGELVGEEAAALLEETLRAYGHDGPHTVIVNLARVQAIDMRGLAALVETHRAVRAAGGEIRLAGCARDLGALAIVTTLATEFNTFPSVDQAIAGSIGEARSERQTP